MIWSSPPMLAITALMAGSATAAWMSTARSSGVEPSFRVVGYSTTFNPKASRSLRNPSSKGSGNWPGSPDEGDNTAIGSAGRGLAG